jgi:hypothetical protein
MAQFRLAKQSRVGQGFLIALQTASARMLVVGCLERESGCRAIPHLDADTGLDLRGTCKCESVHDSLAHDQHTKSRLEGCCRESAMSHASSSARYQRVVVNPDSSDRCFTVAYHLDSIDQHNFDFLFSFPELFSSASRLLLSWLITQIIIVVRRTRKMKKTLMKLYCTLFLACKQTWTND